MKPKYDESFKARAKELIREADKSGKELEAVELTREEARALVAEMQPDEPDEETTFGLGTARYADVTWVWPTLEDGENELKLEEQEAPERLGKKVHVDVPPDKDT